MSWGLGWSRDVLGMSYTALRCTVNTTSAHYLSTWLNHTECRSFRICLKLCNLSQNVKCWGLFALIWPVITVLEIEESRILSKSVQIHWLSDPKIIGTEVTWSKLAQRCLTKSSFLDTGYVVYLSHLYVCSFVII